MPEIDHIVPVRHASDVIDTSLTELQMGISLGFRTAGLHKVNLTKPHEGIVGVIWVKQTRDRPTGAAGRFRPSFSYRVYLICESATYALKYKLMYG